MAPGRWAKACNLLEFDLKPPWALAFARFYQLNITVPVGAAIAQWFVYAFHHAAPGSSPKHTIIKLYVICVM